MPILGVESLVFGVDDMELCARFWRDFGLVERSAEPDRVVFETVEGTTVVIRPHTHPDLPPSPAGSANTARQVVWGVEKKSDLDGIAAALAGLPGVVREGDVLHAVDPNGYAIAFQVANRRPLADPPEQYNAVRKVERRGRRAESYKTAQPQMMSHVVFFAPRYQESIDFYTQRLGFKIMDTYPGRSAFFRADGAIEHHNLFLLHDGNKAAFHHVAFEVRSIHEVFGGGMNLTDKGWPTAVGPGRHPVSSAYFWYFLNPCGGAAEYDWDSDAVSDDWEAKEWPLTDPSNFAEWVATDGTRRFQGFPRQKLKGSAAEVEGELVRIIDEKIAGQPVAAAADRS